MRNSSVTDHSGFDEFVAARSHRLLRTAYMLTHDWASAEDLLQEAMTKAWFAWSRIVGEPEPYVRKIISTSFISQSRRRWRSELPAADIDDQVVMSADAIGTSDERDALWRALGRLPARQRAVVVLRYYEDLPEADVAEALHCSVGTVKSQAAKALVKLRVDSSIGPLAEKETSR
jgi:RNA polymerase sigma-70 factor (sigma-E family)